MKVVRCTYIYIYALFCISMLCSVYSLPTGILRLSWPRFFRASSSAVRQMPGYISQKRGTVRTLPELCSMYCLCPLCCSMYYFVRKCVLYYCHRVSTQLQLNISYLIYIFFVVYLLRRKKPDVCGRTDGITGPDVQPSRFHKPAALKSSTGV